MYSLFSTINIRYKMYINDNYKKNTMRNCQIIATNKFTQTLFSTEIITFKVYTVFLLIRAAL